MKKHFILPALFLQMFFVCSTLTAQTIVTVPVYPTDMDSCTVIFDASKGNAGLLNAPPPIYAHTGVITNLSTSGSDWKYVLAAWNQNIPKALMTPLGNNLYRIKMLPSIRAFYGVPAGELIQKMAFVFRNSDGSKTGREANGGDIFANVYPTITSVKINLPQNKNLYLKALDTIAVNATSPLADTMKIYLNGTLIKTIASHIITDTLLANNFGHNWVKQWVKILAKNDTAAVADSFCYTVIPLPPAASLPAGVQPGINYPDSTSVTLCLYAPGKTSCFATGDFNDWGLDSLHYMNKTPDGSTFWITTHNLIPRREYIFQYLVDGSIKIGDPYCDKVSDPNDQFIDPATYPDLISYPTGKTTGIASVLQTGQAPYPWASSSFTPPAVTDLVIYELLIRDFTNQHTFLSLIDTLNYLKNLGINTIELMPVMEFEGNISWGYNPDYSFAVDKYYGPKNTLKQFVEAAHAKGIAVILDIVCNHHFGSSPLVQLYWDTQNQRPAAGSPWFNPIPKHPYNVGYDFNHDSPDTKSYMSRLLKYWLREYHADGYRFDMSKGFTQVNSYPNNMTLWQQYDQDRINILNTFADTIHSVNPDAYVILEHFADNSEEKVLANAGMMLWGNLNNNYRQAASGWYSGGDWNFSNISWKQRTWTQPNLVGYMESHDEERLMYDCLTYGNTQNSTYNMKSLPIALKRMEMAANFFIPVPGPKMIWMFGELGYDYSINYIGRVAAKPVRWDYLNDPLRKRLNQIYSKLNNLKKTLAVFSTADFQVSLADTVKRINLNSSSMNVSILGNFGIRSSWATPSFQHIGWWYEYWTGDSVQISDINGRMNLKQGEYRLYTDVKLAKPNIISSTGDFSDLASSAPDILVYPNPATGKLFIDCQGMASGEVKIRILDLQGRQMMLKTNEYIPGSNALVVDVSSLDSGIYILELQNSYGTRIARWIKN